MKRNKISRLLAVSMSVCLLAAGVTGCSSSQEDSADQTAEENTSETEGEETEILVAAAASLEYAYEEELIPMFEEENPGVTVKGTYDSSGKLQTQIEEGLEADVFMSAATQQMDALTEEGFVDGESVTDLLENQIVLITSAENELGLDQFDLVVVDDFDWNTLTQEQEEAVFSWVEEGGTLLFGTGAQLEKNLGRLGSRFLEADAGNISSREIELSGPEEDSRAVMVSADCVDFGVKEGRVVLSSGSTSVVTKKNQGNGQIVFTAFGLADIAEVCAQNPVVLEGLFQQIMGKETIQYLAQDQYYSLSNLYYSIQSLINTGNVARLPKVGLYTAVILVYIVLIGPVLYLYLKRKSCQNYYMVSVAVLAVIFTGVIYAMGAKTRFTAPFFYLCDGGELWR